MARKILVTGATGKQGGAVVTALLEARKQSTGAADFEILALTRSPSSPKAQSLSEQPGVTVVKGDLLDEASLVSALQGVDAALLITDYIGIGVEKEVEQGANFIKAAKQAGVRYIVFNSVGNADRAPSVPHFQSKYEVEQILKKEYPGDKSTIVRPVAFFDNFPVAKGGGGVMLYMTLGVFAGCLKGQKLHFVAVKDIGIVSAKALLDEDKLKGQTIELSGDHKTIEEIQESISKVIGRPQGKAPVPGFIGGLMIGTELKKMMQCEFSSRVECRVTVNNS